MTAIDSIRRATLAIFAGLVVFTAASCGPEGWSGLESGDVLLITVDTARADRFSYAGESPVPTPNIDQVAEEGTIFLQAVTPAPITLVAHASIFTGQPPFAHGVRNNGTYRLGEGTTTLADTMRERGLRTAAFVGAAVLDSRYGLDRGFDHYDDEVYENKYRAERSGEEVVDRALTWLGNQQQSTFVWVHLFDPHSPYEPPTPERTRFPTAPYDGEIAYVDRVVGKLLDGYRELNRYEQALIVLTSDHGESLGEHGEETHGVFIYDATMHVPLVIRAPGLGRGRRTDAQVQLVDLLPTLAELAGGTAPAGLAGRSLVPLMRGGSLGEAPVYLESLFPRENFGWSDFRGVRSGGWKLIIGVEPELYDLSSDASELHDLAAEQSRRVAALEAVLRSDFAEREGSTAEALTLDSADRKRLEALGYLGAGRQDRSTTAAGLENGRADPRRRIHLNRARSTAPELFDRGFHQASIDRLEAVLREDPENPWVSHQLLRMLVAAGQHSRAEQRLAVLLKDDGESWAWRFGGSLLELHGQAVEAIEAYETALGLDPLDVGARSRRWEMLLALDGRDQVADEAAAALASDSDDARAFVALARARWADRDHEKLVQVLERESEHRGQEPSILAALGDALFDQRRYDEALPWHNRAQSLEPANEDYGIKLAATLAALGSAEGVHRVLRNLRSRGMLRPEAWLLLGDACLSLGNRPCGIAAMHRVTALAGDRLQDWLRGSLPSLAPEGPGPLASLLLAAGSEVSSPVRFEEGAAADGETRLALLRRSRELLAAGRAAEARGTLEVVYRGEPLDLDVALAYAQACLAEGNTADLRETLSLLAELLLAAEGDLEIFHAGETDVPTLRLTAARSFSFIGTRCWEAGDYWNALHAYLLGELLVADDPRFPFNIGLAWERVGDLSEALAAFERTLKLDPEFPRAGEHQVALSMTVRGRPSP